MTSAAIDRLVRKSEPRDDSSRNGSHHKAKLISLPLLPLQELVRQFGGKVNHPSYNGYGRQNPFYLYIVDLQGKHSAEDIQRSVEKTFGKEKKAMVNYGSIAEVIGLTYDFMIGKERYRLCFHGACNNSSD